MKTTIYYFSGTGNSLKCAMDLAQMLGDTSIEPISKLKDSSIYVDADRVGFVFPVYSWGVPAIVVDFINRLTAFSGKYVFAVVTCGGSVGACLTQLETLLKQRGIKLNAGFKLNMPANCITLYPLKDDQSVANTLIKAQKDLSVIVSKIIEKKEVICRGFFLTNIILSGIVYKLFIGNVKSSDKYFYADEKCVSCGVCAKICPVKNITYFDSKPQWNHNCEHCLACIQWCPKQAIQYNKVTQNRKRYNNPAIKPSMLM